MSMPVGAVLLLITAFLKGRAEMKNGAGAGHTDENVRMPT
jgi:hypothetical protein